jgi:hypothetical protein
MLSYGMADDNVVTWMIKFIFSDTTNTQPYSFLSQRMLLHWALMSYLLLLYSLTAHDVA